MSGIFLSLSRIENELFHRNLSLSNGSMDSIGTTFHPLIQNEWDFSKSLTNRKMCFSIGIYSCPMHPMHLVGLYTTTLTVFRWKTRGYDWILVDSIGQPSVRRTFVGFGISPILCGIAVSSCSVLAVCHRFLISACGVFSFFVSYAYFVLRCLVFAVPSFIHAQSGHEFALLACCYSRWVF